MEVSGKLPSNTPVVTSREPLAGDENVFWTQVEVPALAMGRNGPKTHPVTEQCRLLPVSAAVRPLTDTIGGLPEMFICVSAPPGVGPSATVEAPPPTFKPPQVSAFLVLPAAPPLFTAPHVPPAAPVVNDSTVPSGGLVVELVLLVDVVVARLVLVDELLVVAMLLLVDELVVVARLVVVTASEVLVVLASVVLVLDELVLVLVPGMVDVVVAPGHCEKSIVHSDVQTRNAPVDEPGQVAPPKSLVSHSSPGSMMPLPQRLMVVLVVVDTTVELVVVDSTVVLVVVGGVVVLVVVGGTVLVVVGAPGHCEKSIVHSGVQTRNAPVDDPGHVAPPNSSVSHSSPGSMTPLPHRALTVDDVVLVELTVVVLELELVAVELLVLVTVVVLGAIVLVVVAPGQFDRQD